MKRTHLMLGASATAVGFLAVATTADIVGTSHDFQNFGWSQGEICKPCHVPHHALDLQNSGLLGIQEGVGEVAPLWNHEITVASYDTHTQGVGVPFDQALDSRSILCMSCHDGTVALDAFGGNSGTPGNTIGPAGLIGTDLVDDHPVGADGVYPLVPWMNDPANWEDDHGMHLQDMDVNGTIERVVSCTTCHEPHDRNSQPFMLWQSNLASDLCLTCHLK